MAEVLLHFALPFAFTAPLLGFKRGLLIGLIALLPDLDVLFQIHRSITHSMIFLLALVLPIVILVAYKSPKLKVTAIAAILSLLSHPVLDMLQTYTPIFYPVLKDSLFIEVNAGILINSSNPHPILNPYLNVEVKWMATEFKPFKSLDGPLFTSQNLPISIALILMPIVYRFASMKHIKKNQLSKPKDLLDQTILLVQDPIPQNPAISKEEITVVIPVLNEAEGIGKVIDEIKQEGYNNILVIDGYSSDNTAEVAMSKNVKVIRQHGIGKGGAIKTALEHVNTPYILLMDGDYTYDPKDIKHMLVYAKKYDEVIGSRVRSKAMSLLHRIGNRIINLTFNLLMGTSLSDVCSGMYLVRTEALKDLEIKSRDFSVEVEIAAHISHSGKITEVPINYRKRIGKKKLQSFRDGLVILRTIIWLAMNYNPVMLFASLASILAIPGLIITLRELYLRYLYGAEAWSFGMAWLGLFLLVIGLQGITIAIISLMLRRMEIRILRNLKK